MDQTFTLDTQDDSKFSRMNSRLTVYLQLLALVLTTLIGAWSCIQWKEASYFEGEYYPIGPDSFYHASRILDKYETGKLPQYDHSIHAPEGSLVTWPWAYDTALAYYIASVDYITDSAFKATTILAYSPLILFIVSILLVHGILTALNVSTLNHAIGLIFYSLSHLTQSLYGIGRIDHHGAEQIMFFLVVLLGMRWVTNTRNVAITIVFAAVLGMIPAIHTSLFILILPVSLFLLMEWVKERKLHNIDMLGYATLAFTLLAASQSQAVHEGLFEFNSYSWFHIYISAVFTAFCLYLGHIKFNTKSMVLLVGILTLLSVPVLFQINAFRYLSGDLYGFDGLIETRSPLAGAKNLYIPSLTSWYSGLIYLLPFVVVWCAWSIFKNEHSQIRYLSLAGLFGLLLALVQFRFFVFGTVALIIITVYILDTYVSIPSRYKWLYALFMIISTQAWSVPQLTVAPPTANDSSFTLALPGLKNLKHSCSNPDSIILAYSNDGHYIRYFSKCRVISNNFLLTRQHEEKSQLVIKMFYLPVEELIARYPWVDYVFVRIYPNDLKSFPNMPRLKADLLFKEGPYEIIDDSELSINIGSSSFPVYRLVKLLH